MKIKGTILNILREEMPFLETTYNVHSCGLFGSYAHDEQVLESDIDLLVTFEKPIGFFKFIELEDYLSSRLGTKVDLVTEDAIKPLIKPKIMENITYV